LNKKGIFMVHQRSSPRISASLSVSAFQNHE
jgi:hypothetical protein